MLVSQHASKDSSVSKCFDAAPSFKSVIATQKDVFCYLLLTQFLFAFLFIFIHSLFVSFGAMNYRQR